MALVRSAGYGVDRFAESTDVHEGEEESGVEGVNDSKINSDSG